MLNLYDLLGVGPDDDAESLRKAYRKAAKASHPDHHGGDPHAAMRFRRITQAYDILRDEAKRAAYDRLLEVQRRPLRAKLKQTLAEVKRHVVADAIVGVILTIALAVGYELFVYSSEVPIHEAVAGTVREPAGIAAAEQSSTVGRGGSAGAATPPMPILIPAVAGDAGLAANGALQVAKGEPAPDPPVVQTLEVVKGDSESAVSIDQAITKAIADDAGKNEAGEPPVPQMAPPEDIPLSAPEKHNGAPNLPSSGVALSDIKRDGKTPEPAGSPFGDAKHAAEIRAARLPVAAKRRLPVEEAALESRNASACPGSAGCAGDRPHGDHPPPPLFGVGF
jgi:hypothetical protein